MPNKISYLKSLSTIVLASAVLAGCTSFELISEISKPKKQVVISDADVDYGTRYKIGLPYVIKRRTYYPEVDYSYEEVGLASWYGEAFHGKSTANGATFDMHSITAAHRTLPLPSIVEVENLSNGRKLVVTVNDRGPFHGNRIIDLSMRSAELLGFKQKGVTKVRVRVLSKESKQIADLMKYGIKPRGNITPVKNDTEVLITRVEDGTVDPIEQVSASPLTVVEAPKNASAPSAIYTPRNGVYVQIAAFSKFASAQKIQQRVESYQTSIGKTQNNGRSLYKVLVGPFSSVSAASDVKQQLANNFRGAHVVTWRS